MQSYMLGNFTKTVFSNFIKFTLNKTTHQKKKKKTMVNFLS